MKKLGLLMVLAVMMVAMPASADPAEFPPLFDTVGYRNNSLDALPQWRRVLDEIREEEALYHACGNGIVPCPSKSLLAWYAMMKGQAEQPKMAMLHAVNRFVNQWPHRSDSVNHDQVDYWSSPLTFLRRSGDCEDYAIIKYVSLREMGFPAEDLRIVVVRDTLRDLAHAVLVVHVEGDLYVLDNLFQAVLPQARVRQYLPYYSVNEQARWAHIPNNSMMISSTPWAVTPSAGKTE
ncbi:MAG: transglutaminase-like cysteine peptidase [Geminicoccales bacterium]